MKKPKFKPYEEYRKEKINEYREEMSRTQAISEDYDLDMIIRDDMARIWYEVGGQDGMYDNFPITRVYRDTCEGKNALRVYALDGTGGVAIIQYSETHMQIVGLGEDDGYHFLNSRRLYEDYYGTKPGFVYLLSEALSLFNNVKL